MCWPYGHTIAKNDDLCTMHTKHATANNILGHINVCKGSAVTHGDKFVSWDLLLAFSNTVKQQVFQAGQDASLPSPETREKSALTSSDLTLINDFHHDTNCHKSTATGQDILDVFKYTVKLLKELN